MTTLPDLPDLPHAVGTGPADPVGRAAASPFPVVVLDAAGCVVDVNAPAAALLPDARAGQPLRSPAWLVEAHRTPGAGTPRGPVGDRFVAATAAPLGDGGRTAWWLQDETAHRALAAELAAERRRTRFLAEASSALLASLNPQRCMEVTARLAAEHLADAAVVVTPTGARKLPVVVCDHRGRITRDAVAAAAASELPGLDEALQGFPPTPPRWIDPAAAPDWLVPEGFGEIGAMTVTPLPGHGLSAGALILLGRTRRAAFEAAEGELVGLFAARAGSAMSAARLYAEQNQVTDTLMRALLPPTLRHVEGMEFAGGYRASVDTDRVGGDFYDVHPPGEDCAETLAVLGDVAGKGLDAAVITGRIRNTLNALRPLADDHGRMLRLLNNAMRSEGGRVRFATLVLASARREGRSVALRLTSAGHPPPLIVRRDGTVEEADTGGTLIGVLPEITSRTAHVRLAPGETCVLYTDGVTEAKGGPLGDAQFGEERLTRALAECGGLPAAAVVERVQMLTDAWIGGGRHDDIAVLAVTAPRGEPTGAVDTATVGTRTA
ncbi:GAF domain-containing SpoIIE family protein phosphatase [Streptomyces sp. NPDC029526]|uniref:PP2C family protein-serine/threonine phosphatase n=1 Tax=Streptomyces sp. NPDC029526 TaxID=3155728 RepID=UPI0033DB6F5D